MLGSLLVSVIVGTALERIYGWRDLMRMVVRSNSMMRKMMQFMMLSDWTKALAVWLVAPWFVLVRIARCPMPNAECPMPIAQCLMPNVRCPLPNFPCPMPIDYCLLSDAQRPIPNAECRMPNAYCPMPNA